MKKTKNVFTSRAMLKWLMSTVLVLGVISFSGFASEHKPYNSEPVKTELREARNLSSRKSFCFKRAFANAKHSFIPSENRLENFISILLHQENKQETQRKSRCKELPPIDRQARGFLMHLSSKNSEESELNHSRG